MLPGPLSAIFQSIDSSISIGPLALLSIGGCILGIGLILALILQYHWSSYAIDKMQIFKVKMWFWAGFIFLGGGMVFSIIAYFVIPS